MFKKIHDLRRVARCLAALTLAILLATAQVTAAPAALAWNSLADMPLAPELEPLNPTQPPASGGVLGLPEGARVDDSYFDDAMFVGDSVSLKLEMYVREQRQGLEPDLLGKAKFFCAGSLGSGNLQSEIDEKSVHPSLKGQKMMLEDAVVSAKAKRVYIMLGMNDLAVYGIEGSVKNMMKLIRKVLDKSPNVQIFVQSATPRVAGKDQKTLNNENLKKYDELLYETILDSGLNGVYFVDVASVMRGEDGTLPMDYCSDPDGQGIHFSSKACRIWIDYLYTHTI